MKIRSIIIVLTVPLFLAMSGVNGVLLYFQQKAELSRSLGEQALAAAVVTAEFISAMDDPQKKLIQPLRRQAIDAAGRQVVGLEGIYLVDSAGPVMSLMTDSVDWKPPSDVSADGPVMVRTTGNAGEDRFVAALAPAGNGRFVAARIDAEPMFAKIDNIKRIILMLVLGASIFAAALSWLVARRIGCELEFNGRTLAAIMRGDTMVETDGLRIRETRDLADAVRLMDASNGAAEMRYRRVIARNDRTRDIDQAVARSRAMMFGPVAVDVGGTRIAMRIIGETPPGAFFALAAYRGQASAVIGCCKDDDPVAALAQATVARRFLEANMFDMDADKCLSLAREAFGIETLEVISWRTDKSLQDKAQLLCMTDTQSKATAERYISATPGASPEVWLEGIEVLLAPSGIFVAVGESVSVDG